MRFYALAQRPWIEEDGDGYWGLPPGTIGSVDLSAVGARNRVFVTSDQPFAVGGDILATFGDGTRLDRLALSGRARNDWNNLLGVSVPNGTLLLDALWNILTVHADPDGATRAKPIMPTHRRELNLHLGGHSLLRSEKLPEDPTLHPAWPVMQRVFRNDYRAIQSRDEILARKWLGAQQIKLRVSEERVSELLIDDDLERVAPIRPTTTLQDDFNRADEPLDGSEATVDGVPQGWVWNNIAPGYNVASNRAESIALGVNLTVTAALSSDDNETEARSAGQRNPGVVARADDSEETCYSARLAFAGGGAFGRLDRVVEGAVTIIADIESTSSNAVTYIRADGSDITGRIGGTETTVTDTGITSGLHAGIISSGVGRWHDDFEAADLVAVGVDLVRVLAEAVGADEQHLRPMAVTRQRFHSVGVGHASLRPRSLSRLLGETQGIGEATVSVVEAIGAELLRVVSEAVAATEAMARALGLTRRRHEALGTAEAVRSAREMVRFRSEAGTVSETTASVIDAIIAAVVRVVSEIIGMAEMAGRPRHRARIREETVGLATAVVLVGGVLGAAPAGIADRARMVTRAARRLIDKASNRFNVPPARR